jgi:hypothetical protein
MQGAKKEEINLLPVRKIDIKLLEEYDPASDLRKYLFKNFVTSRCNVCICDYDDREEVRTLPCCKISVTCFELKCITSIRIVLTNGLLETRFVQSAELEFKTSFGYYTLCP